MASRKARRGYEESETRNKKNSKKTSSKKQLIIMIMSIVLMIFTVTQVYYLAKYTIGKDVPQEKLKVYKWVCMLLEGKPDATSEK